MLEDVVEHEIIRGHEQLDAITLRCRIQGPVEVAVLNDDACRLIQPHVVPVGVEGLDVLDPPLVGVEEDDAGLCTAVGVIQRQVLDPVHGRLRAGPPCLWRLRGPPVRHVEAWGDGDMAPVDSSDLHELLLVSIDSTSIPTGRTGT